MERLQLDLSISSRALKINEFDHLPALDSCGENVGSSDEMNSTTASCFPRQESSTSRKNAERALKTACRTMQPTLWSKHLRTLGRVASHGHFRRFLYEATVWSMHWVWSFVENGSNEVLLRIQDQTKAFQTVA
jgi:hypothetical protein